MRIHPLIKVIHSIFIILFLLTNSHAVLACGFDIPPHVQQKFAASFPPLGMIRESGAVLIHDKGKTYLWMSFILTDLQRGIRIDEARIINDTVHVRAQQVPRCTHLQGEALHNIINTILIEDPYNQVKKHHVIMSSMPVGSISIPVETLLPDRSSSNC